MHRPRWRSKSVAVGVPMGLFGPLMSLRYSYIYKEGVGDSLVAKAIWLLNYPAVATLEAWKVESRVGAWLIYLVVPVLLWTALAGLFFHALERRR